jgi:hypothetical protein
MSDEQPSVISRIADSKPSESYLSKLWGGVALLIGMAVWFAVGRFEPQVVAEAAGYSAGVVVFTGWLFWSELERRWFWPFMGGVVVLHVVIVCATPWPLHHVMNKGDTLFGIGDLVLMMAIGALVSRLTRNNEKHPSKA